MSVKRGEESTSTDTSMPPAKMAKTDTKSKEKTVEVKPAGEISRHMKNVACRFLVS